MMYDGWAMKLHLLLAAFTLAAVAWGSEAHAQENWKAAFEVSAKQGDKSLAIAVTPKKGFYVNSAYPLTLKLASESVKLKKDKLGKKDAEFEASGLEGKAKLATFKVSCEGKGKVDGSYKLSICTKSGCSPPLKGTFTSK